MPFPHQYAVELSDHQLSAGPRVPIAVGAPPQFGGTDDVWSPEELFIGAVLLCVKTTFDAMARRAELSVHSWASNAAGVLDKAPGGPVFTSLRVGVDIAVDRGTAARARDLLRSVEHACIISRAIRVPVEIVANVRETE